MNSAIDSRSSESKRKAKKLEELRESLRKQLLQKAQPSDVESDLLQFLRQLGDPLPIKEMLARKLATHFLQKWTVVKNNSLKEVIERRPEELDAALHAAILDRLNLPSLLKALPELPPTKRKRAKPLDEKQRRKNKDRAKNRYDSGRKYRATGVGIIEREFSEKLTLNPFDNRPPSGPCLDKLFAGGEVKMSRGPYCLEDLFAMDRHKLPKNLPYVRRGRERFYQLKSVMECMDRALADKRLIHSWLPNPTKRSVVLSGIIAHVQEVGSAEVAKAVVIILSPYLT